MYYHTCPICGANLDFGERCDCLKENAPETAPTAPKLGAIVLPAKPLGDGSVRIDTAENRKESQCLSY